MENISGILIGLPLWDVGYGDFFAGDSKALTHPGEIKCSRRGIASPIRHHLCGFASGYVKTTDAVAAQLLFAFLLNGAAMGIIFSGGQIKGPYTSFCSRFRRGTGRALWTICGGTRNSGRKTVRHEHPRGQWRRPLARSLCAARDPVTATTRFQSSQARCGIAGFGGGDLLCLHPDRGGRGSHGRDLPPAKDLPTQTRIPARFDRSPKKGGCGKTRPTVG